VAATLSALGDPEELAKRERERLYSARRRGEAAQPPKLWKPEKPGRPAKPDRGAPRDAKLPRMRRTRGSGSRLIRKYGEWPGEPEPAGPGPAGGAPGGSAGRGPATGSPAPAGPPPAGTRPASEQGPGQQASDSPASGGQPGGAPAGGAPASGGAAGGGPASGGEAAGGQWVDGQVVGGPADGRPAAGSPGAAGPGGRPPWVPRARQPDPAETQPKQAWPVIGPGTGSQPADTGGPEDGRHQPAGDAPANGRPANGAGPAQPGAPDSPGGPAGDSTLPGWPAPDGAPGPGGPARDGAAAAPDAAEGTQPVSIVPGMEPAEADEPPGRTKLGRPEPLTEAWAFVRRQPLESVSLLLLGVGGLIYPFPLWLIGAVVSIRSRWWDKRDKWLAFTGPVLFTLVALIVMGITGQGNFFVAFGHAFHHFGLLLRVGCLLSAGYLVWRLRRGPRRRVPPWQRFR